MILKVTSFGILEILSFAGEAAESLRMVKFFATNGR
jgi:hypothetical protein